MMPLQILRQLLKKISLEYSHHSATDSNCHYKKVQEAKKKYDFMIVHLSSKRKSGAEYAFFSWTLHKKTVNWGYH